MTDIFNARLIQANLVTRADFDNKLASLNRKIVSNITKYITIEKKLSCFRGKNHFDENGVQNYYKLQPISKYLKAANVNNIN